MSLSRRSIAAITTLAAVPAALALSPARVDAGAVQAGGVLTITGTFNPDLIEVEVGPTGLVTIQNAPGIVQGTTYSGVTSLRILSENNDDTVDLLLESSMAVYLDTSTGADSVKVEVLAGTTGTMVTSIDAYTATNADSVEIKAESKGANLDISAFHSMSTNDDKIVMEVKGEGSAHWLKAKLRTSDSQSQDNAEMIVTSDATDVTVDMGVNPTTTISAWGEPITYSTPLVASKLIVDHKAAGTLRANLRTLAQSNVVELKGPSRKVVNGAVRGTSANDSLTLYIEGVATGNVVLDGGSGFDSCSTSMGTRVNCES